MGATLPEDLRWGQGETECGKPTKSILGSNLDSFIGGSQSGEEGQEEKQEVVLVSIHSY